MRRKYIFVALTAVAVMMLAGCNNPPNIPRIVPSATLVESGDVVTLSAEVSDPDNEVSELTITWTSTGGDFDQTTGLNVNWTAPDVDAEEVFEITLTVEDPEGEMNSQYEEITVIPDTTPDIEGHIIYIGSKDGTLDYPFSPGRYGRSQFLYLSDEFDTTGKIIKMGLMCAADSAATFDNLKIWFYPVAIDSIVDTLDHNITEATKYLVYQGSSVLYGTKDEWFDFELVSPFIYDGEHNLLIEFEFDIWEGENEDAVETYAFGLGASPARHVGIVRTEDEKGTAENGSLYLKLVFEQKEE